jgi:hypothetical protein
MWTYNQYVNNECNFYQFYSQFMSKEVEDIVEYHLSIKQCEKYYNKDSTLNQLNTQLHQKQLWRLFPNEVELLLQDTGIPKMSELFGICIIKRAIINLLPTKVIFRWWKDSVIAIFIEEPRTMDISTCESYQHIGQHGACSPQWVIQDSRPATEDEYADLKRELESEPYNYRLRVLKKTPNDAIDIRRKKIQRMV